MRLTIHHKTAYRYAHPVVLQPHRMILRPRGSHDIALLSSSLSCSPDAQLEWTQDVFGNLIATGIFPKPAAELVITSEFTVEQSAVAWPVFRIAPEAHSFPFTYSPDDMAGLGALRIPEHNDPERRMGAWARAFVRGASTDTLSLLKDLNAGILGSVAYRVRDEEGTQTPLETLALASGSCRDIAALFIDAVRHLGVGAAPSRAICSMPSKAPTIPDRPMRGRRSIFPARDGSPSTRRTVASAAPTSFRSRSHAAIARSCRSSAAISARQRISSPWMSP